MLKTDICDLFGIEYPIIQGGMAHLATSGLVSAVANSGGLGLIAAANYEAEWLRYQIHSTRTLTNRSFGVNLFLPSQFLKQQIEVILEEKIPFVVTGSGNPVKYLSRFKESGLIIVPVVSNLEQATEVALCGADALIAEGMEAGGHIGRETVFSLVPKIVDSVRIPVIAAGGIVDGRGLAAALALGARGIQMGTRFIFSNESPAHPLLKTIVQNSSRKDTVTIGNSIGRPIRCLRNQFASDYLALEQAGASRSELELYKQGRLYAGVIEGKLDEGLLMMGGSIGLIKEVKPVKEIFTDILTQAQKI
jgi:enoyl-[acyl-carrier protein] reductase II